MQIIIKFLNFIKSNKGSGTIVATIILLPLLAGLIFGTTMYAQMANVQNICEEAARAGARYYAANYGSMDGVELKEQSRLEAAKVVTNSKNITPVKNTDITFPPGTKIGILTTKCNGKYYIDNQWCMPANDTVYTKMKNLVWKKVLAQGEMVESDVFKANEATTNPPEILTTQKVEGIGQPWMGGSQYGVSYSPTDVPKYMEVGKTYNLIVNVKNIGTLSWTSGVFGLAYHWYKEPGHVLKVWEGTRDYVDYTVLPDNTYVFTLPVTAPSDPHDYTLEIDMMHGNTTWFKTKGCPTLNNIKVKVPKGETLKGNLVWYSDYMIGSCIIEHHPSLDPKLTALSNKDVILWGNYNGKAQYFRVDSIEEHKADDWTSEITFDDKLDVEVKKVTTGGKDYAFCRTTYHYPIPVKTLLRLIHLENEPPSRKIAGTAYFELGESGV